VNVGLVTLHVHLGGNGQPHGRQPWRSVHNRAPVNLVRHIKWWRLKSPPIHEDNNKESINYSSTVEASGG
jgi:hypothetical protein